MQAFGKNLKTIEPTLWSYLIFAVKTMVEHDCYDDLEPLVKQLKEIKEPSSEHKAPAPKPDAAAIPPVSAELKQMRSLLQVTTELERRVAMRMEE